MEINFSRKYFKKKFKAIPDEEIGIYDLHNHCSLWHCGVRLEGESYIPTEEAKALINILGGKTFLINNKEVYEYNVVFRINDGIGEYLSLGNSPKERLLNRLKQLKNKHM